MYTKNFLLALRRRTLRRGLWYRTLDSLDRGIYNLTCAVVDRVKSETLLRQILSIVLKLREALKGEFVRLVESLGVRKAWEMAGYAVGWGYGAAWEWRRDEGFARFLAVIEFNAPSGWGV
ncbi:MAG: hypothetical protein NWE79_01920 [Candidatus Bathyarchaeota archaeon]|nr:hypothetical protein [Candidatus Bathyarchaeota archaeon]